MMRLKIHICCYYKVSLKSAHKLQYFYKKYDILLKLNQKNTYNIQIKLKHNDENILRGAFSKTSKCYITFNILSKIH